MSISLLKWTFLQEMLFEDQFLDFEPKIQMGRLLAPSPKDFFLSYIWSVRNDHSERCHWNLSLSFPLHFYLSLTSCKRETSLFVAIICPLMRMIETNTLNAVQQ
jgi:hypothetical protein